MNKEIIEQLKKSLLEQEKQFEDQLILNPVENLPEKYILEPCTSFLHGLYNTDSNRTVEEKRTTNIQFSGRNQITKDISLIYQEWEKILGAEAISMRLLSGLHAHIVLFMSLSKIGDKVLYLSEKAGGHTSGKAILERLGLNIKELPIDYTNHRINKEESLKEIESYNPDFIFVDRSEGLVYEDFSWIKEVRPHIIKIFDASQYLTNIISKDYINPFDMGFDIIISTMHKNLPGPQRALLCSKYADENWGRLKSGISTYVSNMHVFTIYSAGLLLNEMDNLKKLSKNMLTNAIQLDEELLKRGVPIFERNCLNQEKPTHHCWIICHSRDEAFDLYLKLEEVGILTNYRKLPYDIGFGLRLGLSGATQQGLTKDVIPELAEIISDIYHNKDLSTCKKKFLKLLKEIKHHEQ